MKKTVRTAILLAVLLFMLPLSGCFAKSTDELYALPQLSEGYMQLQSELSRILDAGAERSAPTAGSNRQPVQLEDLDGDGVKEAIAFFKVESDAKPLKIYIFRNESDTYTRAAVIEGEGMNVESVSYADITGDGVKELVAGWQMSAGVKQLSVYTMRDYNVSPIITTDYTRYSYLDATGDGQNDLLLLRLSSLELLGEAELYTMQPGGEMEMTSARMSAGVESISQVRTGRLSDSGGSAVFVESVINGNSTVTDVFAFTDGSLRNITADGVTGISEGTMRTYTSVNCRDIDGDGVTEVPCPVQLPSHSMTATYWAVEWYAYTHTGVKKLVTTTFHDNTDGWYLVLPEEWSGRVTVRRGDNISGERTIVFSELGAGVAVVDVLEIGTLTGDGRATRATKSGRFTLISTDSAIYAGQLLSQGDSKLGVTQEYVKENFHLIYSDWLTE